MVVVIGVIFAVIGHVIEVNVQSDWKYFFFDLRPKSIGIAGFFGFCALANFVGTRLPIKRHQRFRLKIISQNWPCQMVVLAAIVVVLFLMIGVVLGIQSKIGLWILMIGAGQPFVLTPIAFFLRGLAPPTRNDP